MYCELSLFNEGINPPMILWKLSNDMLDLKDIATRS